MFAVAGQVVGAGISTTQTIHSQNWRLELWFVQKCILTLSSNSTYRYRRPYDAWSGDLPHPLCLQIFMCRLYCTKPGSWPRWVSQRRVGSVAWWCNGYEVGLATQFHFRPFRFQVTTWGKCLHTCASVTKQYQLVPANGRRCPTAGKVTVGLALHWPCIKSTYKLNGLRKGDKHPVYTSPRSMAPFTLP